MAQSAKRITGTGEVTARNTRLLAISVDITTAGTLTLRAGSASVPGPIRAVIGFVAGNGHLVIPEGMIFPLGLHATYTNLVGGVTFWLG